MDEDYGADEDVDHRSTCTYDAAGRETLMQTTDLAVEEVWWEVRSTWQCP